jgi:AbiU2
VLIVSWGSPFTDPANDGDKNENFTLEFFVNCFPPNSATFQQLDQFHQAMSKHRKKIKPARDKLVAHADRAAIRNGQPLGNGDLVRME